MNHITLTDNKCGTVDYISGDRNNDSLLQASEVWTYRCTTWLLEDTNNQATATGYANSLPANDIAYATVRVGTVLPPPLIHVVKIPNLFLLPFRGGTVKYTYKVSNPGIVALHYVQVTDDECSTVNFISGDTNGDNLLDTNETWTYTCQANLGLTTTNTVTATGNANNETATDIAFASVVVAPRPAVAPSVVQFRPLVPTPSPVPTPAVPLLPNTGVGPDATSILWEIIASGVLVALSFLFAATYAKRLLSSKKTRV